MAVAGRVGGTLDVQVPDAEVCLLVVQGQGGFACECGQAFRTERQFGRTACCGCDPQSVREYGLKRLFGGQDYPGNWHFAGFTHQSLERHLASAGFGAFSEPETEHQRKEWNMRIVAMKREARNS